MIEDYLFPSGNDFDIPSLRLDRQAGNLLLPFTPYGTGCKVYDAQTVPFYTDDRRFSSVWAHPEKLLALNAVAVVEPNYSMFDTTPYAQGLWAIYQKRWIARYMQEHGILVYADLNVSSKFYEGNQLGIPKGYNAFATRGSATHLPELEEELNIARRISGEHTPNLIVYGGGKTVHSFCKDNGLLYIHDFMTAKRL